MYRQELGKTEKMRNVACPARQRREAGEAKPVDPDRPSDAELSAILTGARTIAVVGMSDTEGKAACSIPRILIEHGWDVIPVNPYHGEIAGMRSYPTLADIERPVDLVNVFRPSEEAAEVTRAAIAMGAGGVWLQAGIRSEEARELAVGAGITYVQDACTGALARRLDLHPA